ncbi:MAG: helix-turn-helix domain-containing protein [Ilumatobacteraceae bacterium]
MKNFDILEVEIRKDKKRATRIDAETERLIAEYRRYRLCDRRKALGITQTELAKLVNVSQSAISQIESGAIQMSIDMLRSLIDHIGGQLKITAVFDDRQIPLEP